MASITLHKIPFSMKFAFLFFATILLMKTTHGHGPISSETTHRRRSGTHGFVVVQYHYVSESRNQQVWDAKSFIRRHAKETSPGAETDQFLPNTGKENSPPSVVEMDDDVIKYHDMKNRVTTQGAVKESGSDVEEDVGAKRKGGGGKGKGGSGIAEGLRGVEESGSGLNKGGSGVEESGSDVEEDVGAKGEVGGVRRKGGGGEGKDGGGIAEGLSGLEESGSGLNKGGSGMEESLTAVRESGGKGDTEHSANDTGTRDRIRREGKRGGTREGGGDGLGKEKGGVGEGGVAMEEGGSGMEENSTTVGEDRSGTDTGDSRGDTDTKEGTREGMGGAKEGSTGTGEGEESLGERRGGMVEEGGSVTGQGGGSWVEVEAGGRPTRRDEDYPFRNVSLPWGWRVDNLVGLLTLDEVQLQMARGGHGPDVSPAPPIPRLGVGPYSWNTECLRGVVNAGPATSFPQALGLAATFSPSVLERVARATGLETRAKFNNYTRHGLYGDHRGLSCFSPVVNLMRDPRWGRNQETYGEDPLLTSELARVFVHGLQGNHSRYLLTNAGCKHFDAYGGPENIPVSRFSFDAKVSEVDWHQTFLPAFRACVEAGTYSVMCSYNSINGVPSCANGKLLTDILRRSWAFTGYVVSDQSALERIVTDHHYVTDDVTAAADVINSGVNLEVSSNDVNGVFMHLLAALQKGLVNETTIRDRVKPLFYTRMRLGEFDPPSMNPYTHLNLSIIQSPAHQALSMKAAMKSFVLLKNKGGFLPIRNNFDHVAIVGPMSNNASLIYGDPHKSPTVNITATVTPLQGLRHLGSSVTYAEGCNDISCDEYNRDEVKAAVQKADVIFVCLGTGHFQESEMHDKKDLELPGHQLTLLKDVVTFGSGAPVVLLLFNAGPLNVTWADQHASVSAILECWYPAQSTGMALLQVLTSQGGDSSPAARLPYTWPLTADQIPAMTNYSMSGRTYRYSQAPALYPFGYGLSYTTFRYTQVRLNATAVIAGRSLNGTLVLRNEGDVTSDEVIQVYLQWRHPPPHSSHPTLQLAWFHRVRVPEACGVHVTFTLTPKLMALWLPGQGWTVSPGNMTVYVGGQQPGQRRKVNSNVLNANFTVTGHHNLGMH